MARQEIEAKARLVNKEAVVARLQELGCEISAPMNQRDIWFINFDGPFDGFRTKENFLRIREQDDKIFFTIKQPQANELDVIAYDTEISDAEQMRQAILMMGYHEVVRVNKVRRFAKYQDMEICLDEVENLGAFIEVEKMTEGEDGEALQKELFDFLQTLGISEEDREEHGYDTLVWLKQQGEGRY